MPAYQRKTRCAVSRCQQCTWVETFFGVDIRELKLRAAMEYVLHIATAHARGKRS